MGHVKQVEYNKRWKLNKPDAYRKQLKRRFIWSQISKQFCRIGIYDEYPENRGVKIY